MIPREELSVIVDSTPGEINLVEDDFAVLHRPLSRSFTLPAATIVCLFVWWVGWFLFRLFFLLGD